MAISAVNEHLKDWCLEFGGESLVVNKEKAECLPIIISKDAFRFSLGKDKQKLLLRLKILAQHR